LLGQIHQKEHTKDVAVILASFPITHAGIGGHSVLYLPTHRLPNAVLVLATHPTKALYSNNER
jgi:hypothetical protein